MTEEQFKLLITAKEDLAAYCALAEVAVWLVKNHPIAGDQFKEQFFDPAYIAAEASSAKLQISLIEVAAK